ncbi:AraC family transcriptional regulator ligand-binding domain-containing protein [Mesorhizobium sp. KR9-304]|uniref:AraC family transcriptional regulator n=1 Tax=Mesorhizobium sp. KR9-304 TaxID=3156614 RepID=UPI0032B56F61
MFLTNHFAPTPRKLAEASRFDSVPVISITALAGVPGFVRGAFGEKLLRQANRAAMLDIEAIDDKDCFVPHVTMSTFVSAVARLAGEDSFGLMLAPHLTVASYGCWGEYVLGAPTLGDAIRRAIATIGFHSRGDALSLVVVAGQARLSYASAAKGLDGYAQVACGAAGVVVNVCRSFLPAHIPLRCVELDIPTPRRPGAFEDVFGCAVIFDAPAVTVCFDADRLGAVRRSRGAPSPVTVEDLARARVDCRKLAGLRDVLAEQVWSQVLAGSVSIESAARSLDTSVRTLQRELHREGTDFRAITNLVRSRRALELLRRPDLSVTQISGSLGYSAPAHFARAFRKATGLGPQEFRRFVANQSARPDWSSDGVQSADIANSI